MGCFYSVDPVGKNVSLFLRIAGDNKGPLWMERGLIKFFFLSFFTNTRPPRGSGSSFFSLSKGIPPMRVCFGVFSFSICRMGPPKGAVYIYIYFIFLSLATPISGAWACWWLLLPGFINPLSPKKKGGNFFPEKGIFFDIWRGGGEVPCGHGGRRAKKAIIHFKTKGRQIFFQETLFLFKLFF